MVISRWGNHLERCPCRMASLSLPLRTRSGMKEVRYKGLFSPEAAPTTRAYCLLLSLLLGALMVTAGSVFYHVILTQPMSGSRPMHTPPLALALGLILAGLATLLAVATVAYRLGCDDGDDTLEDDLYYLARDDDPHHDHDHDPPV
ncbi:uncharacterized protein [Panulirus ornatus]|uniref:uncharacterized protein n=1 Tax=Panulirus ornatus TaxID=150431 RepID=UPI003A853C0B